MLIVFFIFSITGSSAMYVSRHVTVPFVAKLCGMDASQTPWSGTWSFRLLYLCVMMPTYSALLLSYGTLFGRGAYFMHFVKKMWSRFLPAPVRKQLKM